MSRPLSASSHQGHQEPTTTRLSFPSVVISTVLARHTNPAAGSRSSSPGARALAPSGLGGDSGIIG